MRAGGGCRRSSDSLAVGTVSAEAEMLATWGTERQLQDAIRTAALRNGWLFYHTHSSIRSDPGFPDCVCVRDGVVLALELKAQRGRVSPAQRAWIDALNRPPVILAAIVRPLPKDGEMSYDDALNLLAGAA